MEWNSLFVLNTHDSPTRTHPRTIPLEVYASPTIPANPLYLTTPLPLHIHTCTHTHPYSYTDDSHLYFEPEKGNVVFTSAVDGFGFGYEGLNTAKVCIYGSCRAGLMRTC